MEKTHPVENLISNRWSARAMSGQTVSDRELNLVFEAARLAPSSYNSQPWRFIFGRNSTASWDKLFELLVDFNKEWVISGSVLILILSRNQFEKTGKPSRTHSFDTGAAWENMALEAYSLGLVVHGLSGFDYEKAKRDFNIPDHYTIEAMCVLGKPGKIEDLPEKMRKEERRREKKSVSEIVSEGIFNFS